MMERQQDSNKKVYATPQLMVFGDLRELTLGGVGSQSEGGAFPKCNNNSANKQLCI